MQVSYFQIGGVLLACIVLVMVVQWISLRRTQADRHARLLQAATQETAVPRRNQLPTRSPLASPRPKIQSDVLDSTSDEESASLVSVGLLPRTLQSETDSESHFQHADETARKLNSISVDEEESNAKVNHFENLPGTRLPSRSPRVPQNPPAESSSGSQRSQEARETFVRLPSSTSSHPDLKPWISSGDEAEGGRGQHPRVPQESLHTLLGIITNEIPSGQNMHSLVRLADPERNHRLADAIA